MTKQLEQTFANHVKSGVKGGLLELDPAATDSVSGAGLLALAAIALAGVVAGAVTYLALE